MPFNIIAPFEQFKGILKAEKAKLKSPQQQKLNIIADTTFFGREFGVLVLIDSLSEKVIYHQIVGSEKDVYYKLAINSFREKGYIIQSITCDSRRGLLKDFMDTPTQMCQFHLVAIVMRALRKKHQSAAEKEFYMRLYYWKIKHKDFLDERSDKPNEKGYFPYKHRNVKSAYASILRYFDYLFTDEKHPEFNIEKTTNRIEGLFSELKRSLIVQNGTTKIIILCL